MKTTNDEFARAGLEALLPGMRYLFKIIQEAIDQKSDLLKLLQEGIGEMATTKRRVASGKSSWPDDPAERSAEMLRRMAVAKQKKGQPSDLSIDRKKQWAALSPAKRKARLDAMMAARTKNKRKRDKEKRAASNAPVVAMEKTA